MSKLPGIRKYLKVLKVSPLKKSLRSSETPKFWSSASDGSVAETEAKWRTPLLIEWNEMPTREIVGGFNELEMEETLLGNILVVNAPRKHYSIKGSTKDRYFGIFNGISIIATTYASGIIPEIQATLAPPVKGKMLKGLCVCYSVIMTTYFSVAISGYWTFGNQAMVTVLSNFMGVEKPLLPTWFLLMTNVFTLVQVLAVTVIAYASYFTELKY
ncbi:hypothetical protein M0R45_002626 [Rubus argutus]|uniref:Amino acid transporter transmembrane domain-containing protein n=1 Tax=Rubus argutus TaxID=59490 RepID=A0AAW1VPC2_RUBAR